MIRIIFAAFALFIVSNNAAFADKLSDFKAAASKAGCESIPYSDNRSSCQSEQPKVHEWCDGRRGPVSCDANLTVNAKRNANNTYTDLQTAKETKAKWDSKRGASSISPEEKRVAEEEYRKASDDLVAKERLYEQAKADLETRGRIVRDTKYNIDQCMAYRRAVMNSFASSIDRARNEYDSPEITALAKQLRDLWETSKAGHEQAIKDKDNALQECRRAEP